MGFLRILILFLTINAPAMAQSQQPLLMNIRSAENFTDRQYDKLMEAKALVEMIINSAAFKSRVLNFTYNGSLEFVQNNGMTNGQIYHYLMSGAERYPFQTEADRMMDFDLKLYKPKWYQSKRVLGYTSRDTSVIHINRNFFNKAEFNQIAMNLVHEWTHKMGFEHDFNRTDRRPYSVPYGVGYIVRDLGNKILGFDSSEELNFDHQP
jgi:hypothetical protein